MILYQVVALLLVGLNIAYGNVVSKSMVSLQNNRYSGIVIAINPNVTEDPSLVDAIKKAWSDASPVLFTATRSRAYFGDITILIPGTWSITAYDKTAERETYDAADVLIANTNPSYGDAPYTVQYGGCGSRGSYIHLTPNYFKYDLEDSFGPREKAIVHEWAHYRWGIFDETDASQPFYDDQDGNVLVNVRDNQTASYTQCPKHTPVCCKRDSVPNDQCHTGTVQCDTDPNTGMFTKSCICYLESNNPVDASIMSHQYPEHVVTFCEDTPGSTREHNKNAPNDQNRLCDLRSTWSVITESTDFNGNNPANPSLSNFVPTFTVKKPETNKRYVLVLDVSGSMGTIEPNTSETRIEIANKAAAYFINTVPTGSFVSIVAFSTTAGTVEQLYRINDNADRKYLIAQLPDTPMSSTCISCGISEAINVLENMGDPAGGYIIVMTDGIGTMEAAVSNEAISKRVIVEALIIYTAANDELVQLTLDTGGSWFFARSDDLLSLIQAYGEFAAPQDGDITSKKLEVYSETIKMDQKKYPSHSSSIAVDSTIGEETTFTYTWSYGTSSLNVMLTSPPGGACSSIHSSPTSSSNSWSVVCADISIDTTNKMMVIIIKGTAQAGVWRSDVDIPSANDQTVSIIVHSKASGVDPIMAESSVESRDGKPIVYAKVTQGMNPVLAANVTATVSVQGGSEVTLSLYDAGADPDIRRNDGIYSRYVTGISSGRYSVKVRVESQYGGSNGTVVRGAFSKATYNPGYYLPNGTVVSNPNGATFLPEGTAFGVSAQDFGSFRRQTSAGAFDYTTTSIGDSLPPSRVLDLSVRQNDFNNVSKGIVVSFTAPGDDYDSGTASLYEIRYTFGSPQDLVNNFNGMSPVLPSNVIQGNLSMPQTAGVSEQFVIVTPTQGSTSSISIGFALKAYDEVNNEAQISNVATLRYYIQPPTFAAPTYAPTTDSQTTVQSTSPTSAASQSSPTTFASTEAPTTDSQTTVQSTSPTSAASQSSPTTFASTDAPTTDSQITVPTVTTTRSDTTIVVTTTSSSKDFKSSLLWLWTSIPIVILREFHQ